MPRWTTRSTDAATVGTTNRAEMFSPASSGSVHIFTSASRALLACSVHMPGSPALSASSRSRHSSARTSPTMIRLGRIRSASLTRSRSRISPVPSRPDCRVCSGTQSGCGKRSSQTSSAETTRSPPGIAAARQFRSVVFPAWVPPATSRLSPARTDASRNAAARGLRVPSSTRSESRPALSTNFRMLTALNPRLMPSSTTCSRCPSGSIASTNGWLTSIRRPLDFSIRSTSSCTCAVLSIRLVSSCRPLRAMKIRLGSLIQISSTAGSSRKGCSGPNPETRATSSPTRASTSGTGATIPVRLRSSCSRTTPSTIRRTNPASRCGSTPSLRTRPRTCRSSCSTSSPSCAARASVGVIAMGGSPENEASWLFPATYVSPGAPQQRASRICGGRRLDR